MILIVSAEADLHARVVTAALRRLGAPVQRLAVDRLAWSDARVSVASNGRVDLAFGEASLLSLQTIWWRRTPAVRFEADTPAQDVAAGRAAWPALWRALWHAKKRAVDVNPAPAADCAEDKVLQLALAARCGFRIPETLVTNDRQAADDFIVQRCAGNAVAKPLAQPASVAGKVWAAYARAVGSRDLPSAECMRRSPVILQKLIADAQPVRALVLGETVLSARIEAPGSLDWRTAATLRVEPYDLPTMVTGQLRVLLNRLGLLMGVLDLLVEPDGQTWFLEVNEQGQFLWLERECADLTLLDAFCRFLQRPHRSFRYAPTAKRLRLAEFDGV